MITVESSAHSMLGEVWYSEADTPLGPWVYARKIVTHDRYSFYNPKQHPEFDQDNGRIIYFEGTYTTTFSGNPDPTPRYDYNQIMYQLDLSDRRLALPVAIYANPSVPARVLDLTRSPRRPISRASGPRAVAFFAPDREGIAVLPVYEQYDPKRGQTLHVESTVRRRVRPKLDRSSSSFRPTSKTTRPRRSPFTSTFSEGGKGRFYSTDARDAQRPDARRGQGSSAASGETRRRYGRGERSWSTGEPSKG